MFIQQIEPDCGRYIDLLDFRNDVIDLIFIGALTLITIAGVVLGIFYQKTV